MTTKEAFSQLISRRGWYKNLGIPEPSASTMAKRFRDGSSISMDKIEEVLQKAGYHIVQERLWDDKVSKIGYLIDMPEEYFGCQEWMDLHAHMFPPETPFIKKIQAMDIYLQKLKALNGPKSIIEKLLEKKD